MIQLTQSLRHWLWENAREALPLITLGHVELLTESMWESYLDWCRTEEGRQYLKGGSKYQEADDEA